MSSAIFVSAGATARPSSTICIGSNVPIQPHSVSAGKRRRSASIRTSAPRPKNVLRQPWTRRVVIDSTSPWPTAIVIGAAFRPRSPSSSKNARPAANDLRSASGTLAWRVGRALVSPRPSKCSAKAGSTPRASDTSGMAKAGPTSRAKASVTTPLSPSTRAVATRGPAGVSMRSVPGSSFDELSSNPSEASASSSAASSRRAVAWSVKRTSSWNGATPSSVSAMRSPKGRASQRAPSFTTAGDWPAALSSIARIRASRFPRSSSNPRSRGSAKSSCAPAE